MIFSILNATADVKQNKKNASAFDTQLNVKFQIKALMKRC